MTDITTVYEIGKVGATESLPYLIICILGISIPAVVGVAVLIARFHGKLLHMKKNFAPITILVGLGWLYFLVPATIANWQKSKSLKSQYASKYYEVTEGKIKVLRTQPKKGHAPGDLIELGGRQFEISYFRTTPAYKLTLAHGGHLANGVNARIFHVGNAILRIDLLSNK